MLMPLGTEDDNIAVARGAGFESVQAEAIDLPVHYPSFQRYWEVSTEIAGPLAIILRGLPEDEREARGILRLPTTQAEALDALAADEVLTGALGQVLTESYLEVRRSEWAAYSAGDEAFEQQGHFLKY